MVFSGKKENPKENPLYKAALKIAANTAGALIDTILPPQSLISGDISDMGADGDLWSHIRFLDEPCCAVCGFPFDFDEGLEALCGRCAIRRPAYSSARAAFAYDDKSRGFILGFKHGGRTQGLAMFAAQMRRAGHRFWPEAPQDTSDRPPIAYQASVYLVPVPLHFTRRIRRRYNQSALLARRISQITGVVFDPDILMRSRATPSQGVSGTVSARYRNVRGAFRVRPKALSRVKGAHIILIDDVMTTGATLEACARSLKKVGAARVDALTLARVVKAAPILT